jgi:hypothetical protein
MLSMGNKGLMIIRSDYFINAVEQGDMVKATEFLKKDIEKDRLHSTYGVCVLIAGCLRGCRLLAWLPRFC